MAFLSFLFRDSIKFKIRCKFEWQFSGRKKLFSTSLSVFEWQQAIITDSCCFWFPMIARFCAHCAHSYNFTFDCTSMDRRRRRWRRRWWWWSVRFCPRNLANQFTSIRWLNGALDVYLCVSVYVCVCMHKINQIKQDKREINKQSNK